VFSTPFTLTIKSAGLEGHSAPSTVTCRFAPREVCNTSDVGAGNSTTLPPDTPSVGQARRFVAERLSDNMDDTTDVLLMTSELVANVISHARTDVTVTVRPGPPVRVEVHDGLAATETFRELLTAGHVMPAPSQEAGRGVAIVRALASRVGLNDDADGGKVVWFEIDAP
jgi:anti-sigma regulatory factor (Ser/Thr protein kinase)